MPLRLHRTGLESGVPNVEKASIKPSSSVSQLSPPTNNLYSLYGIVEGVSLAKARLNVVAVILKARLNVVAGDTKGWVRLGVVAWIVLPVAHSLAPSPPLPYLASVRDRRMVSACACVAGLVFLSSAAGRERVSQLTQRAMW